MNLAVLSLVAGLSLVGINLYLWVRIREVGPPEPMVEALGDRARIVTQAIHLGFIAVGLAFVAHGMVVLTG